MATVGALSTALGTINFGLFIKPMGNQLGIGRTSFGSAMTARLLTGAVASPFVGRLIDRYGSRILLAVAATITGIALFTLGHITQAWQMVALFAITGVIGLGGPASLVTTVPVAKWFVQKRGRAIGMLFIGLPIGGIIFLPLTQFLIDSVGWRNAWAFLAAMGAGTIIPLSLILVRRQPEDMGLLPDGASPTGVGPTSEPSRQRTGQLNAVEEDSWTLQEAVRSSTYWRLVFAFGLGMLSVSSVGLHRIPDFMDRGLDPGMVALATAMDTVALGITTFVLGFVVERVPVRFIGVLAYVFFGTATFLTIIADSHPLLFLAMGTFGLGAGSQMLTQNYLWASYFGRRHLGSIRGAVLPITLLFGGIGAPLAGYVRDNTGSYTSIWSVAIGLMALSATIIAFTPPPQRKPGVADRLP
jgi:MFS family permease